MEKFCSNCSKSYSKNENYCVTCGSKLLRSTSEYNQVKQFKREVTLRLANELIKNEDGSREWLSKDENLLLKNMKEAYKSLPPNFKRLLKLILDIPDRDKSAELVDKCLKYMKKEDIEMQIEYIQETANFYPKNKFLWRALEGAYLTGKDVNGALKCLERLVTIDPNDGEAWGRLAEIYTYQAMFEESINCCKKALEINPNDDYILRALSNIYEYNADIENAIKYAKRLLEKFPDDIEQKKRLEDLLKGKAPLSELGKGMAKDNQKMDNR